jgi:excinuclease ABC subunit A
VDGRTLSLEEEIKLDKQKKHSIEIIVDRLKAGADIRKRLSESVETALETADGNLIVVKITGKSEEEIFFSERNSCPDCGISIPELQPRLFSFNNPFGACPECSGLGITLEFDPDLVIPDKSLSFNEGGVATANPDAAWQKSWFDALARHFDFSLDTPFEKLPKRVMDAILYGTDETLNFQYENRTKTGKFEYSSQFRGILPDLKRRYLETNSEGIKEWLEKFMSQKECSSCGGKRLRPESLAVTVGGLNIHELSRLSVTECVHFFKTINLTETERLIAKQIMKEITARLSFMESVGLEYLTLERKASTLSGGEAQRIRLATQIGSSLVGVLYILDEPTIGLHQRDNQKLIDTLKHLRDIGNTLIVVEHDEQTLRTADYIVDLGPGAGIHGGEVIAKGTLPEILANKKSITGRYLSGAIRIERNGERRRGSAYPPFGRGSTSQGIDVSIPWYAYGHHRRVGSGNRRFLSDIIFPAAYNG